MKILYVITGLGGGGAEKVLVELADQMIEKGNEVKIAYLKGEVIVKPKNPEIQLVYLGLENPLNLIKAYRKYFNLINFFKPDIVHSHMVHANIFVRIFRRFHYPISRLICSAHSSNEGGKIRMLMYRWTHSLSEVTTNVSHHAASNFEKLGAVPMGKIQTVYNGVDLNKFKKTATSKEFRRELGLDFFEPIYLAVGRFHEAKDYPNLLNAFYKLKKTSIFERKRPKLVIVGDGEERSLIENLIYSLNLQEDVFLLGRRNDITEIMNISDFFVLSSKYEGLPTVILEAMACEKFVISTDCGGADEIMNDTGILVPIQNSDALCKAMEATLYMEQPKIYANNLKAKKIIEDKFSLSRSVEAWIRIYG
ncbi:glycosyltransferase [Acinetobacter junii]|uniref:glycosyltransferase n=1 Tax=Acinetobacter junii TaxID=40215 RepID=UPI003FA2C022